MLLALLNSLLHYCLMYYIQLYFQHHHLGRPKEFDGQQRKRRLLTKSTKTPWMGKLNYPHYTNALKQ